MMKQATLARTVPKPVAVPKYAPGDIILHVPDGHNKNRPLRIRIIRVLPPEKWRTPTIPVYGFEFVDPYLEPVPVSNKAMIETVAKALAGEPLSVANPDRLVNQLEFRRLKRT